MHTKYLFVIIFSVIMFSSCSKIKSRKVLKSIANTTDLSSYDYKILFVRDLFSEYPYTIYSKIDIDSTSYAELIKLRINDCMAGIAPPNVPFTSRKVSWESYTSFTIEDIPEWFDIPPSETDIWALYNIDDFNFVNCGEHWNTVIFLKYYNGYCYIILDSIP